MSNTCPNLEKRRIGRSGLHNLSSEFMGMSCRTGPNAVKKKFGQIGWHNFCRLKRVYFAYKLKICKNINLFRIHYKISVKQDYQLPETCKSYVNSDVQTGHQTHLDIFLSKRLVFLLKLMSTKLSKCNWNRFWTAGHDNLARMAYGLWPIADDRWLMSLWKSLVL